MASVLFSGVVLVTNLPVGVLLTQHRQLADTASQVEHLQAENTALEHQAGRLDSAATISGLARSDFGFVEPGQQAYDVLPPSGSPSSVSLSGHVPLDEPPVVPGSTRSEDLLGAGNIDVSGAVGNGKGVTYPAPYPPSGGTGARGRGSGSSQGSGRGAGPASGSGQGFLSRVERTLEFWR